MAGNNRKSSKTKSKGSKSGMDSTAEAALAAVKALPTDQQLAALTAQYTELALQQVQIKSTLASTVTRCEVAERSKDQLNTDYTKAMFSKDKLESLCRELQKQNKTIKDENLARIREEEEKRRDVSNRLNTTLADITGLMTQNSEKNSELRKENQNMGARLNDLVTQYESKQLKTDKIMTQRDLQLQLAEAKLEKAALESTEERKSYLEDKKRMLQEMQTYQQKITNMTGTEMELRTQLSKYSDQFSEFQQTVESSNNVMNKFKKEMDSMTKRFKKLEKESLSWQIKCQKSNTTLIDMVGERATLIAKAEKLTKQNTKLQQLARTLQGQLVQERNERKAMMTATTLSPCEAQHAVGDPARPVSEVLPCAGTLLPSALDTTDKPLDLSRPSEEAVTPLVRECPTEGCRADVETTQVTDGCTGRLPTAQPSDVVASQAARDDCTDKSSCCDAAAHSIDDVARAAQLADIQSQLADLTCTVQNTSLSIVTTKESTIEITELWEV